MAFLHNETTWTIQVLTQSGNKSSYVAWSTIKGHLKPYSLEDKTFNETKVDWEAYKMTIKWIVTISTADQVIISNITYSVSAIKVYKWIWFNTTKILLIRE